MKTNITATDEGKGPSISIAGNNYTILISGEQTGGNYAVIDMLVPPGGGPGPHAHKDIQEVFYVVEGEVDFKMEGGGHKAVKGTLVNIPLGGAVHGFKNNSDKMAHLLCTVVPAGLDAFFMEMGTPVPDNKTFIPPTPPTKELMEKLKALGVKYGQEFYPPDYLD